MNKANSAYAQLSCEIFLSTFCNLSCTYCIARNLEKRVMDVECGKSVIDIFTSMSIGAKELEFIFTGGEPLLEFNSLRNITKYADNKSRQLGMIPTFVLKTNGTILNEKIILFLKNFNFRVVISIDGLPKNHNEFRKTISGAPTHRVITKNIKDLLNNNIDCAASLTVHPSQAKNIIKNVKYLYNIGFRNIEVGPVYGTSEWSKFQISEFAESLMYCAELIREVNKYEHFEIGPINRNSEHVEEILANVWGCKAGATNLAFLPNGQISGCSSLAMLIPEYPNVVIGDIHSGINENSLQNLFSSSQAKIENRKACIHCDTRDNCSGGCAAINLSVNSNALAPPQFYCQTISLLSDVWKIAWNGMSIETVK